MPNFVQKVRTPVSTPSVSPRITRVWHVHEAAIILVTRRLSSLPPPLQNTLFIPSSSSPFFFHFLPGYLRLCIHVSEFYSLHCCLRPQSSRHAGTQRGHTSRHPCSISNPLHSFCLLVVFSHMTDGCFFYFITIRRQLP